jgi:hypothetical protein
LKTCTKFLPINNEPPPPPQQQGFLLAKRTTVIKKCNEDVSGSVTKNGERISDDERKSVSKIQK